MAHGDATVEIRLENDRSEQEKLEKYTTENVTPELKALCEYAHAWALEENRGDDCTLTFSSMLAAMMGSDKPLCRWLQRHLGLRGVPPTRMTKGRSIKNATPPEQYRTTVSFRRALEAARTLRGDGAPQVIDVRHFMAAYAVVPSYHLDDFLRLRIDRRAWCLELSERLCELYADEGVRWKAYATMASAVPMLEFSNDAPTGRDLLNIDREVEAFSRLICARTTATPLSIGVFGAWGSGKSFFMRRVKDRVAHLADSGRTDGRASAYHGQVVQIDFNAWHYSEGTLIACLVDHIFRNLRIEEDDDEATLRRRAAELITQLDRAKQGLAERERGIEEAEARRLSAQRAVDAIEAKIPPEIAAKRREIDAAERGLAEARAELATAQQQAQAAVDAAIAQAPVRAALQLVRDGVDDPAVKTAAKAMTDLVAEVRSVGTRWLPLAIGLGVLVVGLLIAQLVDSKVYAPVISAITALGTVAGTALGWVKKLNAIADRGKQFQDAQARLADEAARAASAAHKPALDALAHQIAMRTTAVDDKRKELEGLLAAPGVAKAELQKLEQERAAAVDERDRAANEVTARQQAVANLSTGTLLGEFLSDKSKDDGYRKNLTIFTQVRNDFERLSRLMERATKEYYGQGKPAPPVSRIVLYIDDLDRCPEDKVIEVLRTVHLLLAFPLFVCVVAVDPRWVTACLWKAPGLVSGDRWHLGPDGPRVHTSDASKDAQLERTFGKPATPADFLEKIFQIPLWLRPVPAAQRPDLVRALLDPDFTVTVAAERSTIPAPAASSDEATAIRAAARAMALAPSPAKRSVEQGASKRAPADQTIDVVELDYLSQLGGLLDGNPRALKRFVNTYRLVKSALSDVELAVFRSHCYMLGRNETRARYLPYRMCMAQLAVLCTQRERALRMVSLADATSATESLGAWLERLAADDRPLADCFRAALREDLTDVAQVAFETFALWLGRTRRYSFYL
ncbi:MAG TPA: P-loop NTPase fold protein [Kofleriaceae bacterium]|nr:P-loop NTPase fold protein [Kofleriaceae bacterium]